MKTVIRGRTYDTEKAKFIGSFYTDNPQSFFFAEIELYQKRNGEYFTYLSQGSIGVVNENRFSPISKEKAEFFKERIRLCKTIS